MRIPTRGSVNRRTGILQYNVVISNNTESKPSKLRLTNHDEQPLLDRDIPIPN